MKLFYCPSYTGFVYTDTSRLMFNEKIVDTTALIEELKLRTGSTAQRKDALERIADYYKAMKMYMKGNPSNLLAQSFAVDSLSTAKECLAWRDALTFSGWNRTIPSPSARIEILAGIEAYFTDTTDKSIGEELQDLIQAVKSGCPLPKQLEIETAIDWKLYSPLEAGLLDALKERGVAVAVQETPQRTDNALSAITELLESTSDKAKSIQQDDSFTILHFEEQDDAIRYLSLQEADSYDVWINADNKAFDNWLYLEGKPASGSRIRATLPPLTQLLPLGLGILACPLNLKNLIDWLAVPLSPLKLSLRNRLEACIAREGGYYNEKCRKILADFINCSDECTDSGTDKQPKKGTEESQKRAACIRNFLPDIQKTETLADGTISRQKAVTFTSALQDWCGNQMAVLNDEKQKAQIAVVRNECKAVLAILETETEERIRFSKLMSLAAGLNSGMDIVQYDAEVGCRTVISGPGQLTCPANKIICCNFSAGEKEKLRYDFLLPGEKTAFKQKLALWDEDTEREYRRRIQMLPFQSAKKLTLVVIDRNETEDVEKHPLYIQLENKLENIADFIRQPDIMQTFSSLSADAPETDNRMNKDAEGITITNAALIKWPALESYSSLENLVYHPFDYAFKNLADISSRGTRSLPEIYTTQGTVAHAVIEKLFNRQKDQAASGMVPFIRENIRSKFDSVFDDAVNGHGAILLLQEHILNLDNYKSQLRSCVERLVDVIEKNHLHVIACEPWLENSRMGFAENIKIGGYADMILADEDSNLVVFDFKWTGNQKKYTDLLKENKSIQLELYRQLTKEMEESGGNGAKAAAYVLLPDVTVISTQDFTGDNTVKVAVQDEKGPLLLQLKNSYAYRRRQISGGFIEEATGFAPDDIRYQQDCGKMNLIPLNFEGTDNPKKQAKRYPEYEFFKTAKKD